MSATSVENTLSDQALPHKGLPNETLPAKILIIRLSSIGDIVQCSAIPRHLKQAFPDSELHWLVRSDNLSLIAHNPHLQKFISFDRKDGFKGWIKLSKELSLANYTHVYDAHNNMRSRILCFFLKPKFFVRRSKNRLKRALLFALKINLFPKPYSAVESYVEPLKKWGIVYDKKGSELYLPEEIKNKVRALIPQGPCIALAPATAWPKKSWPLNYWQAYVSTILATTSYKFIVLGGPQDTFCKDLILDSSRMINLQGKLSLLESAAAVHFCKTLVAADTGILHMGEAQGIDVVGILGPTPFGHPSRSTSIGLQTKLWCQPCSKDGSGPCVNPTYQKCLKLIKADDVLTATHSVLGE